MTSNINIRVATEKDYLDIMETMLEVFDNMENKEFYALGGYDIDKMRKNEATGGFNVVLTDDNSVIGYMNVAMELTGKHLLEITRLEDNTTAEIAHVGILPSYQGKGYFSQMLKFGEDELIKRYPNLKQIIATVHPDNKASLNTFLKNDYYEYKEVTIYGGTERLIVIKDL